VFCQNHDASQAGDGDEVTPERLATMMLELQGLGCHNVNFVTPEHVVPEILEALPIAVRGGLTLPIVYNTSAYDSMESLRWMEGIVDIYMPDFKFWERETAKRLAKAKDYPDRAREAIREMHRQVGVLRTSRDGLAKRGVLVRHLVMPGQGAEAAAIARWLAEELSPDTYLNVMGQYRPDYEVGEIAKKAQPKKREPKYGEIDRAPYAGEMRDVYDAARAAGLWRFDERRPPDPRSLPLLRW
jgi:putative pyruvate formate lyase activating enzyme